MADQKISALSPLATLAAVDELVVVDVSGTESRKITAKNLVQQGVSLIDAGSIPGSALASLGSNAVVTSSLTDGSVTNAKLEHSSFSLGGLTISLGSTDATPALDLTDAINYPASSLSGTVSNAQLTGSIANNKLANSSISLGGVSISLGATNATPAFDLTSATNYPASSLTGTVSNAQLGGSIANSKLANSSIGIGGVTFNLGDSDTTPALDLTDATNYPASSLTGAITNAQLAGSIQGSKLVGGSVTSTELGTNSVTAVELANLSVDTAALIDASVTDAKIADVSGAKLTAGSVPATALVASDLGNGLAISANKVVIDNSVTAGTSAGISFSSEGLVTGTASLASSDLPVADATNVGGVSVPTGSGLSITNAGALSLTNSISPTTVSGVSVDARGLITSITSLTSSDIPTATTSAKGGVIVQSGGGLSVDASGNLTTSSSGISAGTYQSVTVTSKGVVTSGTSLTAAEIPALSAAKITSGSFDAGRIAADSIDGTKLSNSSTTIIQSIAQLGYPTALFTGQLLFDPIAEDAFLWDGNAWNPITTLTKGALVRLGTYDASQSQVDFVTSAGAAAGLTVGQNLPVASESVDGGYVVVSVQGTPSGVAGITGQLSPPDYLLGVTNTSGSNWVEIDLSTTVSSQIASQISYTPFGQLSATNVQSAIDEIETEKLAKSGGEITGELLIGSTGSLVFEGSTADAFETKLVAQDPSVSDKIVTLPNITGTLITTGDTDTVTSTMVDGSLTNTNLDANASIAFTKLASLTSASILVGNASNEVAGVPVTGDISIDNAGLTAIGAGKIVNSMVSGTAAIDGSKVTAASTSAAGVVQLNDSTNSTSTSEAATANALKSAFDLATTANTNAANAAQTTGSTFTGNVSIDNEKELRLFEATGDGSNYTAFKAQAQSSDITYTLPNTSPSAGQVLKASSGTPTTLEWAADSATDATKMPLAGGTFSGSVNLNGSSGDKLTIEDDRILQIGGGTSAGNGKTQLYFSTAGSTYYNVWTSVGLVQFNTTHNFDHQINGVSHFTIASNLITSKKDHHIEGDLNFVETGTGSNYVGFKAPAAITNDLTWTLPAADATSSGQVLSSDGSGVLSWQTISATPEGTAILSTGESGATKFLREDGDGTCSWQSVPSGTTINNNADNRLITGSGTANTLEGESGLTFDGSTLDVTGAATISGVATAGGLKLGDGDIAKFGAGSDLQISHDNSGNINEIQAFQNSTIDICYSVLAGTYGGLKRSFIQCSPNNGPTFNYAADAGSVQKLAVTNLGITVTGSVTAQGVDLPDDGSVQWGASDDLVISHEGSTGKNRIICYNARTLHIERYDGVDLEDMITATPDGTVKLFHDGSERFATSGAGATLSGTLVTTQITSTGNITMSGTGAIKLPAGGTAQQPSSPAVGMFRYNSDDGAFEGYTASGWGAIGGGGGTTYTAITSNTTAAAGDAYLANTTSAGFTVTLPSSPSAGDTVVVADAGGTWATNNLSVARNGENIMGSATNLTCNVNGAVVSLIYSGVTANGWIATPN